MGVRLVHAQGNDSAQTKRPSPLSHCDIQATAPGFQGVCLGSARQGDVNQRTKSVLSCGPMRGLGHGRILAQFVHVKAIEHGGNIYTGDWLAMYVAMLHARHILHAQSSDIVVNLTSSILTILLQNLQTQTKQIYLDLELNICFRFSCIYKLDH
jgi:hypothetical protein